MVVGLGCRRRAHAIDELRELLVSRRARPPWPPSPSLWAAWLLACFELLDLAVPSRGGQPLDWRCLKLTRAALYYMDGANQVQDGRVPASWIGDSAIQLSGRGQERYAVMGRTRDGSLAAHMNTDTCWFNPYGRATTPPNAQVSSGTRHVRCRFVLGSTRGGMRGVDTTPRGRSDAREVYKI